MPLVNAVPGKKRTVRVLKTDEKGSDVELATYLLLDGMDDRYQPSQPSSSRTTLIWRRRCGSRTSGSALFTWSAREIRRSRRRLHPSCDVARGLLMDATRAAPPLRCAVAVTAGLAVGENDPPPALVVLIDRVNASPSRRGLGENEAAPSLS